MVCKCELDTMFKFIPGLLRVAAPAAHTLAVPSLGSRLPVPPQQAGQVGAAGPPPAGPQLLLVLIALSQWKFPLQRPRGSHANHSGCSGEAIWYLCAKLAVRRKTSSAPSQAQRLVLDFHVYKRQLSKVQCSKEPEVLVPACACTSTTKQELILFIPYKASKVGLCSQQRATFAVFPF